MMAFLKSLFTNKKRLAITVAVILIVGYIGYSRFSTSAAPTSYVLAQASTQTIISSVSGTGQVSQDRSVQLTPPGSGKLTSVTAVQGQTLAMGQTIAVLDETNNTISLNQAKANLVSAQATYDQTLAGTLPTDIQLAQLTVQSDQQSVADASSSLQSTIAQQQQDVANSLSNYLSSGLQAVPTNTNNQNSSNPTISGSYTGTNQGSYKISVSNTGSGQEVDISGLESSTQNFSKNVPLLLGTKGLYITFTGNAYNNDSWTVNIPNPLSSSYTSNYNAYQSAITSQQTAIQNAQNQLSSAQNKLQQDQINLQVKQEPPTDQQIESAKASLQQAQASLQNAQIAYDNNIITAPFSGVLEQLNNQAGDEVSASTVIGIMGTNQSIAVIPLNEVDVSKVKLGDKATMTFDAVSGLTITGTVVEIDNVGTVSQGVVTYNVKIAFDTEDPRVKPGMSIAVSIITNIAADVLSVPNGAIQTQGNLSYVLVLDPSQTTAAPTGQQGVVAKVPPTQVVVQVGTSDDTNTQITSGSLKAGDSVVTQTISPSNAKTAASSATSALRLGGGGAFGGGGGATFRTIGGGGGAAPRPGG